MRGEARRAIAASMKCPVCGDSLPISATFCSFCGYNFRTGARGKVEAPPTNAARDARRKGLALVSAGVPLVVVCCVGLILPSTIFRAILIFGAIPTAGGIVAKGMNLLSQARRWDLKQRLADESQTAAEGGIGGTRSSAAAPR